MSASPKVRRAEAGLRVKDGVETFGGAESGAFRDLGHAQVRGDEQFTSVRDLGFVNRGEDGAMQLLAELPSNWRRETPA